MRTIPDEAWQHVAQSVFRDGHLYPEVMRWDGKQMISEECHDEELERWLCYFTIENYQEWAGAVVLCPRGPHLSETMVRFDDVKQFIARGYRNPFRELGVPDWYFFWTRNHTMGSLKKWARAQGLLPAKDLPKGRGGYGFDCGMRGVDEGTNDR